MKIYLLEICPFVITICKSDDTSQLHIKDVCWGYKFTKSPEMINSMRYMGDIKLFGKKKRGGKRTGVSYTNNKNILSGYGNGIRHR